MSLTVEDLHNVYTVTYDARRRWRNILLELGLDFFVMENIGSKWQDNPDDCYREGLLEWLTSGARSWRDLVEALSSPTVRFNNIAEEIERDYLQTQVHQPGKPLTFKDLRHVYKVTFDARTKWMILGLELGLDIAVIGSIREKCMDNPDDCYREVLVEWLKRGGRSWRDLVEALSSPTVGFKDIAEEIERDYLQTQDIQSAPPSIYRQLITSELVIFTNKQLGNGAFGTVFEGSYRGMPCAVKVLHNIAMEIQTRVPMGQAAEGAIKTFDRECEFLKSFQHPNIVQHLATERHPTSGNTILVIELMDCNLRVYFSELGEESLSDDYQINFSKNIAAGLAYIHSKHVIHRDLCGDNILLKLAQPIPVAKISDFGTSRLLVPSQLSSTLTAMGHRMGYLPPEAPRLEEEQYDYSLDVFSLGVIMVQIVNKLETIKSPRDRSFFVSNMPNAHVLKHLINKCLQEDMRRRPSASQVCDELDSFSLIQSYENTPASTASPTKPSDFLGMDDIKHVYTALYPVSPHWFELGLALGVEYSALRSFRHNYCNNLECLRDMLAYRLQAGVPLTWKELCEALRSPVVNHYAVAERIESEWVQEPIQESIKQPGSIVTRKASPKLDSSTLQFSTETEDTCKTNSSDIGIPPPKQIKIGDTLGMKDLHRLLTALHPVFPHWFNLGLALGVEYSALQSFRHEYRNTLECMREMLAYRLQTCVPLTWKELCEALRSPIVEHYDVAERIESEWVQAEGIESKWTQEVIEASGKFSSCDIVKFSTEDLLCAHSQLWDVPELKVHFLNPEILSNPVRPWRCGDEPLTTALILAWATCWNQNETSVPLIRYEEVRKEDADIRVKFQSTSTLAAKSWSKVGNEARCVIDLDKPTMVLDLYGLTQRQQRNTILHQFGHALGLQHEHQRSDFWKILGSKDWLWRYRFIIGEDKMRTGESFAADRSPISCTRANDQVFTKTDARYEYDPQSIMHYSFDINWLKPEYRDLQSSEYLRLKVEEQAVIRGLHDRSPDKISDLPAEPSPLDYKFLASAYYDNKRLKNKVQYMDYASSASEKPK